MKRLATALLIAGCITAAAQQPQPSLPPAASAPAVSTPGPATPGLRPAPAPRSPEIAADGVVTFRLLAPAAATVRVNGSWQKPADAPLNMTKGDNGVWTATVNTLNPELWTYTFVVDGVRIADPGNVNLQRDGTRYLSVLIVPGPGSALLEEGDVPHGSVGEVWYPSPTLALSQRRMYVYTPAGYESSKAKYPVLYLLHGAGGDEDAWDNMGRMHQIMDHLIASGAARPMIVVTTNGNFNQTGAPGVTVQTPGNGYSPDLAKPSAPAPIQQFSNSVVNDVLPYIEKNYRVIADRDHRAVAGLSMGGAQTALIGFNHLDKFSYIATFSGAFTLWPNAMKRAAPIPGTTGPGVGQGLDLDVVANTFPTLNASTNAKLHLLYISVGADDGLVGANQQFMDWLTTQGVQYQKKIVPGYAHVWPFWRVSLADFVPQIFQTAKKS